MTNSKIELDLPKLPEGCYWNIKEVAFPDIDYPVYNLYLMQDNDQGEDVPVVFNGIWMDIYSPAKIYARQLNAFDVQMTAMQLLRNTRLVGSNTNRHYSNSDFVGRWPREA